MLIAGFDAGEPVAAIAQKVVAHFAILDHVKGFGQGPQSEDHFEVHVVGNGLIAGKVLNAAQEFATNALHEMVFHGLESLLKACLKLWVLQLLDGFEVLIKFFGFGDAQADGVDSRIVEGENVVEADGAERLGEFDEFGRRVVEFAAFVCWTDDEQSHVVIFGGIEAGVIAAIDEVPVQVHVVEGVAADGVGDVLAEAVGGKSNAADFAAPLVFFDDLHAAAISEDPIGVLGKVEAVKSEEVDALHLEQFKAQVEILFEVFGVFGGADFGLKDKIFAFEALEGEAELVLTGAVASCRFDVATAHRQAFVEDVLDVFLVGWIEFFWFWSRPIHLVAHASRTEDGHVDFGAAKASSDHEGLCFSMQKSEPLMFPMKNQRSRFSRNGATGKAMKKRGV